MNDTELISQLKDIWSRQQSTENAGRGSVTRSATTAPAAGSMARSARLDLRITPDEKHRTELLAFREGVAINVLFGRMLDLFEHHHGRVELISTKGPRRT